VLSVRGNVAEVPGTFVPWIPLAAGFSPGEQSIKAQNRLGGSAEARGRASGCSWSATLDGSWGSSTPTECSRRVDGTTRYLLDGVSVVAQYAPTGQRQAWYTQSLARIDEVLSVVNESGKQWYQADALGSVYGLTNSNGALVGHQHYDVFGAPTPTPSGPAGQPFGFTGREHELDSGLVYARNRFLNPSTGTWTRPDPLGLVAGVNYYVYSARGVTSASDPLGLFLVTRSTMEAYAIAHFEAWVSLMVDLGLINLIREANKNEINVQTDCPPGDDKDKGPITYYRGLSVADARELAFMGEISSKMRRSGADLEQGYEAHMGGTAARQHLYTSRGSPYVSVTLSQDVARRFALGSGKPPKDPDDAPSGVVVSVITKRPPARPGVPEDLEYLFFWMIGQPTDQIVPVEWH
jgi:RHS repeat-associated protein